MNSDGLSPGTYSIFLKGWGTCCNKCATHPVITTFFKSSSSWEVSFHQYYTIFKCYWNFLHQSLEKIVLIVKATTSTHRVVLLCIIHFFLCKTTCDSGSFEGIIKFWARNLSLCQFFSSFVILYLLANCNTFNYYPNEVLTEPWVSGLSTVELCDFFL